MATIPKTFTNSVVALGVASVGMSDPQWIGTGFIVGRKLTNDSTRSFLYLVTNKHVFANHTEMVVCVNKADGSGVLHLPLKLRDPSSKKQLFSVHSRRNVDIAAVELNASVMIDMNSQLNWFDIDDHALTLEEMKSTGVDEGCLVYALGFPMGIVDHAIKTPFLRLGCISRIEDAFMDIGDSSYFVDSQTFPGNSGGPIVSRPEGMAITGTTSNNAANLIGILNSYLPYRDWLASEQTGQRMMLHQENSGLTKVFPVDRIMEVIDGEYHRCHGNG